MKVPEFERFMDISDQIKDHGEKQISIKDRKLERRLANRDDVRDIVIVTVPPLDSLKGTKGVKAVNKAIDSFSSKTRASWAMHWAIAIGDSYFELQRVRGDPTRTGLAVSKWDEKKKQQIIERYPQGSTALTDEEIEDIGDRQFSRLDRLNFNNYSIWHHNCQIVVDRLLQEIGGLSHLRSNLKSVGQFIRAFFCDSIIITTKTYYQARGCEAAVIEKHTDVLANALECITARSVHYPKRQWMREDILKKDSIRGKAGTLGNHLLQSILESSLSLRRGAEFSYFERGPDGKPMLKMDLVKKAVKGIFHSGQDADMLAWLKALPWLIAGFMVGTLRWSVAVMALASQAMAAGFDKVKDGFQGLIHGSPKEDTTQIESDQTREGQNSKSKAVDCQTEPANPKPRKRQGSSGDRKSKPAKAKSKSSSADDGLVVRYEKRIAPSGAEIFHDRKEDIDTWVPPPEQELGRMITDLPLPRRWEEKTNEEGSRFYEHAITGERRDERPGITQKWVTKKRVTPNWIGSKIMPLPPGWQVDYTEDGERRYINHNQNPPLTQSEHPMRKEIEEERKSLLMENWNVEWDDDRGKKYRNLSTGEIRWKAVDGPKSHTTAPQLTSPNPGISRKSTNKTFEEPLPLGWTMRKDYRGRKTYHQLGSPKSRHTHPNDDRRARAGKQWEMRYADFGWTQKEYWICWDRDGGGSTWWMRSKLPKNTSVKNNARGWKLRKDGKGWEWFEGGDVPHKDIPVLDLDDAAEFELREYPFIPPQKLTSDDGKFIEPLTSNWVRRRDDNENLSYFDFENNVWSDQHPCEKERQELGAIWEMRYTRHGKRYYLNYFDGSTFWNNPHKHKYEREVRAQGGQKQNGWKLDEGGEWITFETLPNSVEEERATNDLTLSRTGSTISEIPESGQAEEAAHDLELLQIADSPTAAAENEEEAEALSTHAFTRDWLEGINSDEVLERAKKALEDTKEISDDALLRSTQWIVGHGKRIREDKRMAKMEQWLNQHGASEKADRVKTRVRQWRERRQSLRKQSLNGLGIDNETVEEAMVGVVSPAERRKRLQRRFGERTGSKEKIAKLKEMKARGEDLRSKYRERRSSRKSFQRKDSTPTNPASLEEEMELEKTTSPDLLQGDDNFASKDSPSKISADDNLHEDVEDAPVPTSTDQKLPTDRIGTPVLNLGGEISQEPEDIQALPNYDPNPTPSREVRLLQEINALEGKPFQSEMPAPKQDDEHSQDTKEIEQNTTDETPSRSAPEAQATKQVDPSSTAETSASDDPSSNPVPEEERRQASSPVPEIEQSRPEMKKTSSLAKLAKAGRENLSRQASDFRQKRKAAATGK